MSTLGAGLVGALLLGSALPATAWAAPGDASAQGVVVALNGGALRALLNADAVVGSATAPAGGGDAPTGSGSLATALASAVGVTGTGTVVAVDASRGPTASTASAEVTDVTLDLFGTQVLATGDATAEVTCPQTGPLTAETTLTGLTLFGDAVTLDANTPAVTAAAGVVVPGLTGAQLTATLTRVETTTADVATAIAVRATLSVTGTTIFGPLAVTLGTVTIASARCERPAAAPAAPDATAITPTSGPTTGGQTVTITGTGFAPGATVTIGGNPATGVTVNPAGTVITAVTPAHAAGPVDVVVTNPNGGGSDTLPGAYTYVAAPAGAPDATAITPTSGPTTGGQTVTITGTGLAGTTEVTFDGVPATIVSTSPTSVVVRTPAHPAGTVDVALTTPGGTDTLPRAYTYVAPGGAGGGGGVGGPGDDADAPTVDSLTPNRGPTAGGQTVVITGSGFSDGATVTFDGVPALSVAVVDDDTLVVRTPPGTAGPADVVVTVNGVASDPLTYTYVAGATVPSAPTADALDPDRGSTAGGTRVTVTGSGFVPGQTSVIVCDTTLLPSDVTVAAGGRSLSFGTPACEAGDEDVVVVTPGGVTAALTYTYTEGADGSGVGGAGDDGGAGGDLAQTGVEIARIGALGLLLLVAGAALTAAARRRRTLPF